MPSRFKTKTPVSNAPTGVNVKDILSFAAGKTDGSLTGSDIESVIARAGIRDKDAKNIRKAAANFLTSGNEFRLAEDGNYNVYGGGAAKTSSARSTGNRVGLNPGDVVGLGNNMGKLVGLAKMFSAAFNESKNPKAPPAATPPAGTAGTAAPAPLATPPAATSSKGGSGKKSSGPIKPADLVAGPSADFEDRLKAFREKYNTSDTETAQTTEDPNFKKWDPKLTESMMNWHFGSPAEQMGEAIDAVGVWAPWFLGGLGAAGALARGARALPKVLSKVPNMSRWLAGKIKMPPVSSTPAGALPKPPLQIPQNATPPPPAQLPNWGSPAPKPRFRIQGEAATPPKPRMRVKIPSESAPGKAGKPKFRMEDGGKIKTADLLGPDYWKNFNANLGKNVQMPGNSTMAPQTASVSSPGRFQSAELGADQFGMGDESGQGLAAFGKVAKYTLPFIGTHLANRELGKVKSVNFKPAELMAGVVRDIPRPNMGLRYRVPTGVDVQSEIAGQKFADAQQRDAEANYNVANAQSRIGQQQQVVNNLNRNELYNNQGENNARFFNANQLMGLASMRSQNVQEPFIAAQHHLATDISTDAYLKSSNDMQAAEMILKTAPAGSPEYQQALRKLGYGRTTPTPVPRGRKGMKFKIAC